MKETLNDLNTEFTVGGTTYESFLEEDLFINRADLSAEFARHADRFAWYATCLELAEDVYLKRKADLDHAYAMIDHEKRGELLTSGIKATEKIVENSVITDPRYIALQNQYLDAQKQVGLLKAARDAMIHRKDMLISLGATYRAEVRSDMSLLTNEVKNRETR